MKDNFLTYQNVYLNDYPPQKICCSAGMGLVDSIPPDYFPARFHMNSRGRYHNRLTFLTAVNADAFDRFPLFAIGSDPNPDKILFKNYFYDKRACVTPPIFNQWIHRFVVYINGFQDRRLVILIIPFNLVHGLFSQIQSIPDIIIKFVPDSFTSNTPMLLNSMGIHSSMKILYRVSYLVEAMTKITLQRSNPFDMNLYQVHRIIQRIWKELGAGIIIATWKSSFIINHPQTTQRPATDMEARWNNMDSGFTIDHLYSLLIAVRRFPTTMDLSTYHTNLPERYSSLICSDNFLAIWAAEECEEPPSHSYSPSI